MSRAEEYLRKMRALGYEPSLDGMDDEDIEYELRKLDGGPQELRPAYTRYRPVDKGLEARLLRQMGQPYDPRYIPKGEEFYIGGWDNGEDKTASPGGVRRPEAGTCAGAGMTTPGEGSGKDAGLYWSVDPLGMFPRYGAQNQPAGQQNDNAPTVKHPQYLWDEYIWKSPDVISAQTPKEKRGAVNRILDERRGEFDAAYNAAYGDKAADRWENDKKFTLGAMGDYVSADQLKAFGWQNVNDDMVKDLNNTLIKYDITSPARMKHFLAQCAKETNKGESYTERDYGDKTYFNRMYEGRKEIGNIYPGDGEKFIGGGGIHITGRKEYQDFADYVGDPKVVEGGAEYVAKKYPWVTAGRWWEKNRMNELVDSLKGEDHDADVDNVTDVVNPGDGQKARQQRKDYHREIRGIIKD